MIRLLIALHPRGWKARYGDEFQALLEAGPLTFAVVLDVTRHALGAQIRVHAVGLRLIVALVLSSIGEFLVVYSKLADNILWPPSTPLRAIALAAVLLPWVPVVAARRGRAGHLRGRSRADSEQEG